MNVCYIKIEKEAGHVAFYVLLCLVVSLTWYLELEAPWDSR